MCGCAVVIVVCIWVYRCSSGLATSDTFGSQGSEISDLRQSKLVFPEPRFRGFQPPGKEPKWDSLFHSER